MNLAEEVKHPWAPGRRLGLAKVTVGCSCAPGNNLFPGLQKGGDQQRVTRLYTEEVPALVGGDTTRRLVVQGNFQRPSVCNVAHFSATAGGSPAETVLPVTPLKDAGEKVRLGRMCQNNCYRQTISQALLRLPKQPSPQGFALGSFDCCLPEGPL